MSTTISLNTKTNTTKWEINENEVFPIQNEEVIVDSITQNDGAHSPTIDVEDDSDFPSSMLNDQSTADEIENDSESQLNLSEVENNTKSNTCMKKTSNLSLEVSRENHVLNEEYVDEDEEMKKIKTQFKQGCDCEETNCFETLDPKSVYRHRLNITELTKAEHDMYLMGLTKACMSCNQTTNRNKERQRLRAHYFYQGRNVCLTAFLFLENCTRYQLKRIRHHIITHGITPRIHGNHGKRPHNMFSLETYNQASEFLKKYFEQCNTGSGYSRVPFTISTELLTRKHIHDLYIKNCMGESKSKDKLMGYCTFLSFIKHQFPHIRFIKPDASSKTIKEIPKDKLFKQHNTTAINTLDISSDLPSSSLNMNQTCDRKYEVVFPTNKDEQIILTESNQINNNSQNINQVVFSTPNSINQQELCIPQQSTYIVTTPNYQITTQPVFLLTNIN